MQEVQIARLVRGGVLRHDRKLGERARAEIKDTREDGIARLEASQLPTSTTTPAKSLPSVAGS